MSRDRSSKREEKDSGGVVKTCLPLQKNGGREREWAEFVS